MDPAQLAALLSRLPPAHVIELGPGRGYAVVRSRSGQHAAHPAGLAAHRRLALSLQLLAAAMAPPSMLQQRHAQQPQLPLLQPVKQLLPSLPCKRPAVDLAGTPARAAKRLRRGAGSCPGAHPAAHLAAAACSMHASRAASHCTRLWLSVGLLRPAADSR